jgi:hypothetical protein
MGARVDTPTLAPEPLAEQQLRPCAFERGKRVPERDRLLEMQLGPRILRQSPTAREQREPGPVGHLLDPGLVGVDVVGDLVEPV